MFQDNGEYFPTHSGCHSIAHLNLLGCSLAEFKVAHRDNALFPDTGVSDFPKPHDKPEVGRSGSEMSRREALT